ncbi:CheR family methyltransferase [Geoalkalibacter halelectricus]|uniref:CheR family methyltransferase n=1 Tax=Geoalkalibacter halelectricus TaxID=2847045 RepID=UPI00266EEBCA|nr:CheR family methyltransferase [Geoalkalibacter halelectricus]MDO3378338.1 histidine kinase [Geoalkalibacter halelectricus]
MNPHPGTSKPLRVWVAETPGGLCADLVPLLGEAGCTVQCVATDDAPLPAVRVGDCDVLVLGIELPGPQALERLRRFESGRLSRQVPVIVVANRAELEYELPDAFDFLTLPVDARRLLAGVRRAASVARIEEQRLPPLEALDLILFQNYLVQHSGLHFDQRNLRILQHGLTRRMRALGLSSYRAYFDYLESFGEARQELKKLLGLLTVGETYFFRYLAHFEALRHQVLPELIARNRARRTLRLWSAGCSTGEEPYSLGILLRAHFPELREWDVRILATDINHQALNKARRGVYGSRSLRVTDPALISTWFEQRGSEYLLDESIRALVDFRYLNLQTGSYPDPGAGIADFDIIFCRNVLIYFRQATSRKVVEGLARSLAPGGSLFLGHAETLINLSRQFERASHERSFFYRLPAAPPTLEAPPRPPEPPVAPQTLPEVARARTTEADAPPAPARDAEQLYAEGQEAFNREDFAGARACFEKILAVDEQHPGAWVGSGFVHANRGAIEQARTCCEHALAADDLHAPAYFLKGLLLELEGHWLEAREEYRKALLIDMDFIMPRFHLGGIHERLGQGADARRELRNSVRLLERLPTEALVPLSGGLTREVFLEVCRDQLNQLPSS